MARGARDLTRRRRLTASALSFALLALGSVATGGCSGPAVTSQGPSGQPSDGTGTAGTQEGSEGRASQRPDPSGTVPPAADEGAGRQPRTGPCPTADRLSVEQQIRQTLMLWGDGSSDLPAALRRGRPAVGGVFVSGSATAGLTDGTYRRLARRAVPPLVAVDDEGGDVQRIDAIAGDLPSPREQAATMTPVEVRRLAADRGRAMRTAGITMDLAPVVDLDDRAAGVIAARSYSRDPQVATRYAAAFAAGLGDAGVIPTLKHFPGHGRADGDSHTTLPTTPPLRSLERQDLVPYREILPGVSGPVAVMVGHVVVPGLTDDGVPASLDPATYAYLRDRIGFEGPVLTDELTGMQAATAGRTVEETAAAALAAGANLLLLAAPGDVEALVDGLADRVADGRLPAARVAEAADRVLAVKRCRA